MADNWDEAKGKIKERAGEAAGDRDLEREGKVDRGKGAVKRGVDRAGDAVQERLRSDDESS